MQAGGEYDQFLGRLDLEYTYTEGAWTLTDFDGYLYDLEGVEPDQEIQDLIDSVSQTAQTEAADEAA